MMRCSACLLWLAFCPAISTAPAPPPASCVPSQGAGSGFCERPLTGLARQMLVPPVVEKAGKES